MSDRIQPAYPDPAELKDCRRSAEWAAVAAAASDAGIFERLAESNRSIEELAAIMGFDRRALGIVLGVLEALALIRTRDGRLELTEEGKARYADPSSDRYEANAARHWRDSMREWLRLGEALRAGSPSAHSPGAGDKRPSEPVSSFAARMAVKPSEQVERLVDLCLDRHPEARSVLDLGGGPGVHSRAFVRRGLRATLFDTPETIEHVGDAYGLAAIPQIELIAGDFLETLPDGHFDIVLLSNITHIYDAAANRELTHRIGRHQASGDLLAIMDFVRGLSAFAPLFAVTMLLKTESGDTHPLAAYKEWLDSSGYEAVEIESIDADRQLVSALKR